MTGICRAVSPPFQVYSSYQTYSSLTVCLFFQAFDGLYGLSEHWFMPELFLPGYTYSGHTDLGVEKRLGFGIITGYIDDPFSQSLGEAVRDRAKNREFFFNEGEPGRRYLLVIAFVET